MTIDSFNSLDQLNTNSDMSGKTVFIKNPSSGLVLDASGSIVRLEAYSQNPSQLWQLEPTGDGKHIIVNVGNGNVLDMEGERKSGASIITSTKHGVDNQQWYINHDNTIVNATGNLALDITQSKFVAGTNIIAFYLHGGPNQKFEIVSK